MSPKSTAVRAAGRDRPTNEHLGEFETKHMRINVGPQHPSTHGVLRLVVDLDGERIVSLRPHVGYLHTGFEKTMENRTYQQGVTYSNRMDYVNAFAHDLAYVLGVEKLVDARVPERAQRVVQSLVSLFVESGLGRKQQDTESARRFLDEQIAGYEKKLADAENRLKDFRLRNMGLLGDSGKDYVSQIAALSQAAQAARLELREAENSRDSLRRQLVGEEPVLLPEASSTIGVSIPEIDGRIDTLKRNLDEMLLRYTEQHPDVSGTRRVIEELEAQKLEQVQAMRAAGGGSQFGALNSNPVFQQMKLALAESEARVASLMARVAEYDERLASLRGLAERLPEIEAEMAQLNRDYAVHKQNYDSLVQRREQANISVDMGARAGVADFRVIDPPALPTAPSQPNRMVLIPIIGLLGLGAGFALTFLISQLRPAFTDGRVLREVLGLPVLGTVSMLSTPQRVRERSRGLMIFGTSVVLFVAAMAAATMAIKLIQG